MKRLATIALLPALAVAQSADAPRTSASQLLDWCRELGDAEHRGAAAFGLWRSGPSVVPLLVREVQQCTASAGPALQLLARFGRDALPAATPLQRLRDTGAHRHHAGIGLALASIGERESIVVASYTGGFIVELDPDGQELRRVVQPMVWGVAPLPGDRLLVTAENDGEVREIDWQGVVHWRAAVPTSPLDALRLPDGTTVVACWTGSCVVWLDGAGEIVRRLDGISAVDLELLWNGNLLVADYAGKRLVEIDDEGQIVWSFACPAQPMDVDLLPSGNLHVTLNLPNSIVEYARDEDTLREISKIETAMQPEDVCRLRDGRVLLTHDEGVSLSDAEGRELWRVNVGHGSQAIVRLATVR